MKQPLLKRASLESFAKPTPSRTINHPHYATITPKPELKKRSGGELSPDDPRFIGYAYLAGDGESAPGTSTSSSSDHSHSNGADTFPSSD